MSEYEREQAHATNRILSLEERLGNSIQFASLKKQLLLQLVNQLMERARNLHSTPFSSLPPQ